MRVKTSHTLYFIDILTVLLILIITFFPNNVIRIILGLPFVLFFPGYVLLSALFPRKENLSEIERLALDFGLSLAVVPLLGLVLNYTPWGINPNSILYSLSGFVIIFSIIAWFRQRKLTDSETPSFRIEFTWWGKKSLLEKILSVVLVFVIIGSIGALVYSIAVPKVDERYTEFSVLNSEGQAKDYPEQLLLGNTGKVNLVIANRELQDTTYRIC